jgi:hypothetical protein
MYGLHMRLSTLQEPMAPNPLMLMIIVQQLYQVEVDENEARLQGARLATGGEAGHVSRTAVCVARRVTDNYALRYMVRIHGARAHGNDLPVRGQASYGDAAKRQEAWRLQATGLEEELVAAAQAT